jgi:hypothetical protein
MNRIDMPPRRKLISENPEPRNREGQDCHHNRDQAAKVSRPVRGAFVEPPTPDNRLDDGESHQDEHAED